MYEVPLNNLGFLWIFRGNVVSLHNKTCEVAFEAEDYHTIDEVFHHKEKVIV